MKKIFVLLFLMVTACACAEPLDNVCGIRLGITKEELLDDIKNTNWEVEGSFSDSIFLKSKKTDFFGLDVYECSVSFKNNKSYLVDIKLNHILRTSRIKDVEKIMVSKYANEKYKKLYEAGRDRHYISENGTSFFFNYDNNLKSFVFMK